MKGALDLAFVVGLVALPFRAMRRSPRFLAGGAMVLAFGFYVYMLYGRPG